MTDFTGGPGFDAFVATALLTLVVIGLSWSVTRELRKARVNAPQDDAADAADGSAAAPETGVAESTVEIEDEDGDTRA